jgi:hypothetical protein
MSDATAPSKPTWDSDNSWVFLAVIIEVLNLPHVNSRSHPDLRFARRVRCGSLTRPSGCEVCLDARMGWCPAPISGRSPVDLVSAEELDDQR